MNLRSALLGLSVVATGVPALAGEIRIAERPNAGTFTTLQGAIDAALEGESLIVVPGTYAPFTIDGKSVHLFVTGESARVKIQGRVSVRNLSAGQSVLLTRLDLKGVVAWPEINSTLDVANVAGHVRVEDCLIEGWRGSSFSASAGSAVRLTDAWNVVLSGCWIEGGYPGFLSGKWPVEGGIGIEALRSSFAVYDSSVEGGTGSDETYPRGGHGGAACSALQYGLFASNTTFAGGKGGGGDYVACTTGGDGGTGLVLQSAQAHLLANTLTGGIGGWSSCPPAASPGQPLSATGSVVDHLAGARRSLTATRIVADDLPASVTIQGQPGDRVFLLEGGRPFFQWKPAFRGIWLVPWPLLQRHVSLGTIPASGQLVLQRLFPVPAGSTPCRRVWLQALCIDLAGVATLTGPAHVLSIETANQTWHVDAAAAPGGNGSAGAPFQTLSQGIAASYFGDTVLLAPGTYVGPGNRNLSLGGRSLTLRSSAGAQSCTIDAQGQARILSVAEGEALVIEGILFQNGFTSGQGGALSSIGGSLLVRDCVFATSKAVHSGGAVYSRNGLLQFEGCTFTGNLSPPLNWGEGGAIHVDRTALGVQGCVFFDNEAKVGGAISVAFGSGEKIRIAHSSFLGNRASLGGAIYDLSILPAGGVLRLDDCLLAGNSASEDGGALFANAGTVITSSTFVRNSAGDQGGTLLLRRSSAFELHDSVVVQGSAPNGAEIILGDHTIPAQLLVTYSDVAGGAAGVSVHAGSTLTWGAGNLDVDPSFTDPDGPDNQVGTVLDNDYTLSLASPCIDAGDNARLALDFLDVDGDGIQLEPVPWDLRHLPRRVDQPGVPDTGAGTAPITDMGAYER